MPAPLTFRFPIHGITNVWNLYLSYIKVDNIGPIIAPRLKKALILPKSFPLIFSGMRSAFKARDAGMATLCPKDRKTITTADEMRLGAKGKIIVAIREGRPPKAMIGFLPILSEIFPAKKLQVNPTNPDSDKIIPICGEVA